MLHKTAWVSIWTNIAAGRSLRHTTISPSVSIARNMSTQTAVPITATPAAGQLVEHNGKTYETIREGQAHILIPPNTQKHVDPQAKTKDSEKPQNVFYNPIQQFNRDLSVLGIKAFGEDWMQRKRLRNEKNREKNNNRRAKKRKAGEVNGEECGVKLRKSEDGSPKAVRGDEGQEQTVQDAALAGTSQENGTGETIAEAGREQQEEQQNGHAEKPAGPRFRILDALSATGLRALRYAKEIPFVSAVVANDMNPNAIKSMERNVQHNDLTSYITPNLGDAIGHMYSMAYPPTNSHGPTHVSHKYDVIDLDPYGTAAPFIDGALQALNDGGLLCVTCTDSGVFASTGYCEKTFSLYGGMPAKGPYMHEAGLRLIIGSIASAAAKYGIAIEPLLSLSIDFYARAFIRVRKSPADVKFLAGKTMLVYACDSGCGAFTTNMLGRNTRQTSKNGTPWYKHSIAVAPTSDRLCEHCGTKPHIAGPMWGGPIHNAAFISKILEDIETVDPETYQTLPRVEGMLSTALDELLVNEQATKYTPTIKRSETDEIIPLIPPETIDSHPFFINPSALSKVIHCVAPSDSAVKGALRHAGYICTRSHCQPGSIKTNAPWSVIWEVMREWTRQKQPIKEGALRETTAGFRIMQRARKAEETSNGTAEPAGEGSKDDTPEIVTEGVKPAAPGEVDVRKMKVVFDEVLGKDKPGKKVVRYQQNPRENWGPMTKAKGSA